jgi:uncharacterized protein (DUF433 family)/DNA-binding transcriptional MerR regulator
MQRAAHKDPLAGGFYTLRDAARLLRVPQPTVRSWVAVPKRPLPRLIQRSYSPADGAQTVSFLDLIEMRFISYYRRKGVPLQRLRRAAEMARKEIKTDRPFAMGGRVQFMSERKNIFLHIAKDENDDMLLNLVSGQVAMYDIIERSLERGLTFGEDGLARRWQPDESVPHVYVDPLHAFGQPVVGDKEAVPTAAILRSYRAEGGNADEVARWWDVPCAYVEEAVAFEGAL